MQPRVVMILATVVVTSGVCVFGAICYYKVLRVHVTFWLSAILPFTAVHNKVVLRQR